jgi:two-component sensor histidine kinase
MNNVARVQVVEHKKLISVPITSKEKPAIGNDFEEKWQELVDLAARIIGVPAGLIMRLLEQEIEVFKSSHTDNNPYEPGEKADLGFGLYCETVVGKRKELLVPYALKDENWKDNPDVKLNMVSYYGVPIRWPDGEVFGTFCVLDDKENHYTEDQKTLVYKFAELVERDLEILHRREETLSELAYKETQLREMRHRIKNQLNMLISYIDLHKGTDEGDSSSLANDMQSRIKALYKLHETLTKAEVDISIPLSEQLRHISEAILSGAPFDIEINVSGPAIYCSEDQIVPISMMLNELLTNSCKYAFEGIANPRITLECRESGHEISLSYTDNGNSSQGNEDIQEGLGSLIIDGLAAQLSAKTSKNFENGFHFVLTIPKNEWQFMDNCDS